MITPQHGRWMGAEGLHLRPTSGSTTSQAENLNKSHNLSELQFQHL